MGARPHTPPSNDAPQTDAAESLLPPPLLTAPPPGMKRVPLYIAARPYQSQAPLCRAAYSGLHCALNTQHTGRGKAARAVRGPGAGGLSQTLPVLWRGEAARPPARPPAAQRPPESAPARPWQRGARGDGHHRPAYALVRRTHAGAAAPRVRWARGRRAGRGPRPASPAAKKWQRRRRHRCKQFRGSGRKGRVLQRPRPAATDVF
ncbi:MAG: hypothetical protein J3K34DRAFT_6405 [Monoraphidium minutum]|nr:MAG: hypothetical protein J3K34DRAFT_6405 [Monoraphidium minutum]